MQTETSPAAAAEGQTKKEIDVYIDGEFFPRSEAKISVFDHGLLYGDGIFEGIRIYDGCIFRLDQHLERLYDCSKYTMLNIGMDRKDMVQAIAETVRRNGLRDGYIRLLVTRGVGDLGIDPIKCEKPSIIIIADAIQMFPQELYDNGLKIVTASTTRNSVASLNGRMKSLNYLNNVMGKIEARNGGCLEAIMLDHNGYVVECTGDNLFIVKNNIIYTSPTYLGPLNGITRLYIIESAREKGLEVREEPFTRFEVYTADEIFLTGTGAEVIPVVGVDGREIGSGTPGAITKDLIKSFRDIVRKDGYMVYE